MIRYIRVLGAALGGAIGLALATSGDGLFTGRDYAGAFLAAWVVAWIVAGFAILPYLTVVPAAVADPPRRGALDRRVRRRRHRPAARPADGPSARASRCAAWPRPGAPCCRSASRSSSASGCSAWSSPSARTCSIAAEAVGHPPAAGAGARRRLSRGEPRIVVDTSAIIDGRIAEIVESGFIYGTLVIPRFVLDELQHIADSSDTLRRNRGRRGLDILNRMQKEPSTPVEIVEDDVPEIAEVDAKLVALALARSRVILTNDFNLNRVAELQGVRVMNINSLANAVKPAVLPGEELRVRVIQEGKEAGQGVGFLDDGTMIVVEGGARHIDKELDVSVTRVLQTVAGRMIFAQPRLD